MRLLDSGIGLEAHLAPLPLLLLPGTQGCYDVLCLVALNLTLLFSSLLERNPQDTNLEDVCFSAPGLLGPGITN